tara:strand:- start:322 stop:474 length:153 start_codon:yes stop_codon:yes gene_type:complete
MLPETSSDLQGEIAAERILLTSVCATQNIDYCTNVQVIEGREHFQEWRPN